MAEPTPGQEADEGVFEAVLEEWWQQHPDKRPAYKGGSRFMDEPEQRSLARHIWEGCYGYALQKRGCDETCPCRSGEQEAKRGR